MNSFNYVIIPVSRMSGREPLAISNQNQDIGAKIKREVNNDLMKKVIRVIIILISTHILLIVYNIRVQEDSNKVAVEKASIILLAVALLISLPIAAMISVPSVTPRGIKESMGISMVMNDTNYRLTLLGKLLFPIILVSYSIFALIIMLLYNYIA